MADCKDVAKDFEDLKKYQDDVLARSDAKEFIEARMKQYEAEIEKAEKNISEIERNIMIQNFRLGEESKL